MAAYTFISISSSLAGTCIVGMIAKWSLTFALLNTRLVGFNHPFSRTVLENSPYSVPAKFSSVVFATSR